MSCFTQKQKTQNTMTLRILYILRMGHYENLRDILYMHMNAFIVVALLHML